MISEVFKWMGADDSKIHEISLGVRDIFFESHPDCRKAELHERFGDDPVILSVGELSWVKRKDIPLRALALLTKDYPKAKLVFVGKDGGQQTYLKELVARLNLQKNVFFEGFVTSDQLVDYYSVADVLVHTSDAEGLSTIILEALACGLPVVSTPAGGNAQLIKKINAGIVVPFNDPKSVSSAVNKILENVSLQKLFSRNGRNYAVNNLRWPQVAQKHLSLYRQMLKEDMTDNQYSTLVDKPSTKGPIAN